MVGTIHVARTNMTFKSKTFYGVTNLIQLLPTGTVFLFQFLNPILTNNGRCDRALNKYVSLALITLCEISCCVSCFTDSYQGGHGVTCYGFVSIKGMWPSTDGSLTDLSSYNLRFGDFMHMVLTLFLFSVLALLDTCTVKCFYPLFASSEKTLIMVLPPVIGVVAGTVFMVFPNTRHGIGYSSS